MIWDNNKQWIIRQQKIYTINIYYEVSVSHTLIYLWRPATISKLTATDRFFQKALTSLNKHEHCTFQNRNTVRVFLYHCISEGNRLFSENFGCHFHFILHVMPDKEAFVIVSASEVTPTERWLNVWYIWHTYLETLQEFWSHHRIGWIIQDFRETCVSRSLTLHLETKMPWRQTPSRKKKAAVFTNVTTSAYQDQLNAEFSKVCENFKFRGIESLKYVREY